MDEDERALLALQEQFLSSNEGAAASVVKHGRPGDVDGKIKEDIPGERVELDLEAGGGPEARCNGAFGSVIKDIVEHDHDFNDDHAFAAAPAAPLPRPKKIDWQNKPKSRFAAARAASNAKKDTKVTNSSTVDDVHKLIDQENQEKLSSMTKEEIESEKKELLKTLDPQLIKALERRRTKQKSASGDEPDFGPQFTSERISAISTVKSSTSKHATDRKDETDSTPATNGTASDTNFMSQEYTSVEEAMQAEATEEQHKHTSACLPASNSSHDHGSIHFPAPPAEPDLDPSSETFLDDLKEKYFPTLDHDPASLSWMRAPSQAEDMADYHESQTSLMPAQLRFDFNGDLIAPRTSRELDAHLGLHHHADAPLAAGYTVPELAHLARSSFPSQACMAMQIIGRVMYKLGKSFYGESITGKVEALVNKSLIEQTLLERSGDRHMGVRSYATEALWQANLGREGQIFEGT